MARFSRFSRPLLFPPIGFFLLLVRSPVLLARCLRVFSDRSPLPIYKWALLFFFSSLIVGFFFPPLHLTPLESYSLFFPPLVVF